MRVSARGVIVLAVSVAAVAPFALSARPPAPQDDTRSRPL